MACLACLARYDVDGGDEGGSVIVGEKSDR